MTGLSAGATLVSQHYSPLTRVGLFGGPETLGAAINELQNLIYAA